MKRDEVVEATIQALVFLTKNGPSTASSIAKAVGKRTLGARLGKAMLLGCVHVVGLIEKLDPPPGTPIKWFWPSVYVITDAGRAYLQSLDELDMRAPFAQFDHKKEPAPEA